MPDRLGRIVHSCGHHTPVAARGTRVVPFPCSACRPRGERESVLAVLLTAGCHCNDTWNAEAHS